MTYVSPLKISFIIPVLNAQRHIQRCLKSIRAQDYPQELVEIVVLDAGCSDSTIDIAKKFGAKVYPNPKMLAEYGLQVGIKNSTGDLLVIFAADNELATTGWLKTASAPFIEDAGCAAVWGALRSGDEDPPLNRYFELIQSDPMTFFMNRNLERYLSDAKTVVSGNRYFFRVDPKRPLVWGANGLVLRKEFVAHIWTQEGYLGDNDAFQRMVEEGRDMVAYIPGLVTYHHHVGAIGDWIGKWKRNFLKHFLDKLETRNTNWVFAGNFRSRLALWLLYSTVPLISGAHALYLGVRDRNRFWAYHPVLCFLQTSVYAYFIVATPKGRETILRIARGRMGRLRAA